MTLELSQQSFKELLSNTSREVLPVFLKWAKETADSLLADMEPSSDDVMMRNIQDDLRESLPFDAILPTETIVPPTAGQNSDCRPATTVHVDGFLYEDDVIDDLCDQRKMSRNYCCQCGSHQVAPLTFVSHSSSLTQCKYMFQHLLPDLRGKMVVDVGSRLGAVLYAAYYYSSAARIVGVEMNHDLCQLQQKVIDKYQLQDRVQIIEADVSTQDEAVAAADVIILNNVFEFFAPNDIQQRIWCYLRQTVRKSGTLLLVSPSLETSLQHLQTGIDLASWVKAVDTRSAMNTANLNIYGRPDHEDSDLEDIQMYEVL